MKTSPDPAKKLFIKIPVQQPKIAVPKKKKPKIALSLINWKLPFFSMRQ
jgi:hypothetical protein